MQQKTIYLAYKTDEWHTSSSYELVYIGEDVDDVIAQLRAHSCMTEGQEDDIRCCIKCNRCMQSISNNVGYEWDIQEHSLNAFV